MDPMDPAGGSLRGPLRLKSFKRNRPSFIHVTAEAMQRQKSLRIHNNPWEYPSNQRKNRRRTVPTRLPPNAELQRSSLETIFTEDQNDIKPHGMNDSIQDQVIHEIELKTFSEENMEENSHEDSILKEDSAGEEQEHKSHKQQVFIDRHTATVIWGRNKSMKDTICTSTVFENHRKSLIQHCERNELRLLIE